MRLPGWVAETPGERSAIPSPKSRRAGDAAWGWSFSREKEQAKASALRGASRVGWEQGMSVSQR